MTQRQKMNAAVVDVGMGAVEQMMAAVLSDLRMILPAADGCRSRKLSARA